MLKVTIELDCPLGDALGAKEQIAMELEKLGGVRVVSVEEIRPAQMRIGGGSHV